MNWDDRPNKVLILPIYRSAQYRCRYPQKLRAERCLLEWFSLEGQEIGILFGADMQLHQRAGAPVKAAAGHTAEPNNYAR